MRNSQPLLDAILNETTRDPVPAAIREARRVQRARRRNRIALSTLGLAAAILLVSQLVLPSREQPVPSQAAAPEPGFKFFSTGETPFGLVNFSTTAIAGPLARFSSDRIPLAIRPIDDTTLFTLLNPYGPAIVYLGAEKQPTLLLLHQPN